MRTSALSRADRALRRQLLDLFFAEQVALSRLNRSVGRAAIVGDTADHQPDDPAFAARWRAVEQRVIDDGAAPDFALHVTALAMGSDPAQPAVARLAAVGRHAAGVFDDAIAVGSWPGRRRVGGAAAIAAEFLFGHADAFEDLRTRALPLLREAVLRGDADPRRYGHVVDRECQRHGRAQDYGTIRLPIDGKIEFRWPADDPAQIDKRRAEIGIPSLADDAAAFDAGARPGPALGPFTRADYLKLFAPLIPHGIAYLLSPRRRRLHAAA